MKGVQPDLDDCVRRVIAHLHQGLGKATEERLDYLARNRRLLSATHRNELIQALAIVEWYAKEYAQKLGATVIEVDPERPSPLAAPVLHLEGESEKRQERA